MTVVVLDLDGVLWRGDEAIPGSVEAVAALRDSGARVAFLTNNSSLRVEDYLAKFARFGIAAEAGEVLTSAQAAAALLGESMPKGSSVLACAGAGVVEALQGAGFEIVDDGPADAVVVGWHRDVRLRAARPGVTRGARRRPIRRDQHRSRPTPVRRTSSPEPVRSSPRSRPHPGGRPRLPGSRSRRARPWCASGWATTGSWWATGRRPTGRWPPCWAGRSRSCCRASAATTRRSRCPRRRRRSWPTIWRRWCRILLPEIRTGPR